MPAKYSHVKKRSASGLLKKGSSNLYVKDVSHHHTRLPNPHIDKSISQAMSAVSQLEHTIARILLLRYQQDIARLFSTRLYSVALVHLPTFAMRCIALGGPGWLVHNHDSDDIKDFFRAAMSMDLRQAGERVATKSVLWSYTALRHFALSNNISVCSKRGLHSLLLLPFFPALQAHLDALEAMPPPSFSKPPHLGSLQEGQEALEDACELRYGFMPEQSTAGGWDTDWRVKVRLGYERLVQALWRVSREFDVRGYGTLLREKLMTKWCDCGCSTDHLGEVCERTVREDEEAKGMTIGDMMEWRFFKAEREKEEGNVAFRQGDYEKAVKHYEVAHEIEPELPHYQLNLAAAHLKLSNWIEAEKACTSALGQHRSSKGYYRRARARRMRNRTEDAIRDLRSALKLQPTNNEAVAELASLLPPDPLPDSNSKSKGPNLSSPSSSSSYFRPGSVNGQAPGPGLVIGVGNEKQQPKSKFKPSKQTPFVRTKADERRLKVVLIPATAAELALEEHEETITRVTHHPHDSSDITAKGKGKDKEQARTENGKGKVNTRPDENGSGKAEKSKWREMEEIVRSETVVYPGWDRYIVKRMD